MFVILKCILMKIYYRFSKSTRFIRQKCEITTHLNKFHISEDQYQNALICNFTQHFKIVIVHFILKGSTRKDANDISQKQSAPTMLVYLETLTLIIQKSKVFQHMLSLLKCFWKAARQVYSDKISPLEVTTVNLFSLKNERI